MAKADGRDVLAGYNGTIFAYGQTGSGKTFTMYGPDEMTPDLMGIVPRASRHIFQHIENDTRPIEYSIKASFLEIYREKIRDLLKPSDKELKVRESPQKGVWVEGLTEEFVSCEQGVLSALSVYPPPLAVFSLFAFLFFFFGFKSLIRGDRKY